MPPEVLSNCELVQRCCASEDSEAWEEFIRRTRRLVTGTVCRIAARWNERRAEVLEELVQETYLHLYCKDRQALRKLHAHSDDSIFGFLKVIAANVTHDHLRAQNAAKRGPCVTESTDDDSEKKLPIQIAVSSDVEHNVLLVEIEVWLDKLVSGRDAEKHKTIFWLYFRQGMTAAAIAGIPAFGLTTKGIESVLSRLTRALQEKIKVPEGRKVATSAGPPGNVKD